MVDTRDENNDVARKPSGLSLILASTVVAGIAGYGIQLLVPKVAGAEIFTAFAAFWSAVYLIVSALSGVQQELSRATTLRPGPDAGLASTRTRNVAAEFGIHLSIGVFLVVLVSGFFWVPLVVHDASWALAFPLACSVGSAVLVATLTGTLYGVQRWGAIALLVSVDGMLRLAFVGLALLLQLGMTGLAWAVAVPFPLALGVIWFSIRRGLAGTTAIDVDMRTLTWNVARTVVAGAATGTIISGFPALFTAFSPAAAGTTTLASLLLVITLTRAPLIIPVLALQGFLIVRFRDNLGRFWREFVTLVVGIAVVAVLCALLAWLIGPWVLQTIFSGEYDVPGGIMALLVASAGITGALCVSGPAVLATGRHAGFTAGWVLGALVTVGVLLLPLEVETKAVVALAVGPASGFILHVIVLLQKPVAVGAGTAAAGTTV